MTANSNGVHPVPAAPGSAVYVDTENLQDNDRAREIVAQVIANWPEGCPPLAGLSLYVRADKTAMWQLWVEAEYPALRVRVRGVQHFSNNKAKNSADLAITADAIGDLATGQAATIAVVSNDSDFGALFIKVRELASAAGPEQTPFLWITTADGSSGISPEIERFIPERLRWDLSATEPEPTTAPAIPVVATTPTAPKPTAKSSPVAVPSVALTGTGTAGRGGNPGSTAIVEELIRSLPVGKFKASDAQRVIKSLWPRHPAIGNTSKVGDLLNDVWPMLQERGVLMTRKSSPRTYEITQTAKDSLAPSNKSDGKSKTDEPSSEQLAAAVASAITEDIFSATAAQPAIKARWPQHPAAATTAQRFGAWFAEQLWPVMEQHGVVLAKEKPRRYEMTPDARHRLTALSQQ